jgi:trimeric autotransporter adhesin
MKTLRKTFALVLACALCLGVLFTGVDASEFKDYSDITYAQAVQVLYGLGVVGGYGDGTFAPQKDITRAEFCKIICVMMNGGEDPKLGTPKTYLFNDTQGHWAAPYIEYLASISILSGYEDSSFRPEGTITGLEAAKILLLIMGYDSARDGLTGANWAAAVDALAGSNNLYDGMVSGFRTSAKLSREAAVLMFYNTLWQYMRAPGSNAGLAANATGSTLFEFFFGSKVTLFDGVVMKNGFGSVYVESRNSYGSLSYFSDKNSTQITNRNGGSKIFNVCTDAGLLGKSVRVVNFHDVHADNQIVTVVEAKDSNREYYTKAGGFIPGSEIGMDLKNALIITNYSISSSAVSSVKIAAGYGWETTITDDDGSGAAEYIFQYVTAGYKAISVSGGFNLIRLSDGHTITNADMISSSGLPTSAYLFSQKSFVSKTGAAATVKPDSVILASLYGGNAWLSDYSMFTGTLNKVTADTNEVNLTIDGVVYKLHDTSIKADYTLSVINHDGSNVATLACMKEGSVLKFYTDEYGYIFYAVPISQ